MILAITHRTPIRLLSTPEHCQTQELATEAMCLVGVRQLVSTPEEVCAQSQAGESELSLPTLLVGYNASIHRGIIPPLQMRKDYGSGILRNPPKGRMDAEQVGLT